MSPHTGCGGAGIPEGTGLGGRNPGAPDGPAARTVLASLLAQAPPGPAVVIIAAGDAARLLPGAGAAKVADLSVPVALQAALNETGILILTGACTGVASGAARPPDGGPGIMLIAACGRVVVQSLAGIAGSGRSPGCGCRKPVSPGWMLR